MSMALLLSPNFHPFHRWLSPAGLDLAQRLLNYDPISRISAAQALDAPYFTAESPAPEMPTSYVINTKAFVTSLRLSLSKLEGEWHELESKRDRAERARRKKAELEP